MAVTSSDCDYAYHLDDNAASTTVVDATGTSNGTATSNTSTLTATGKIDEAFSFGGSDNVDCNFQMPDDTAGAISCWLKPDNTTDITMVICDRTSTGEYFQIAQINNAFQFRINDGTTYTITSSSTFTAGNWYHIVISWGSNGMVIFQNGASVGTDANTGGWISNSNLIIGGSPSNGNFKGDIDEVNVFNKQLVLADAQELYNSGDGFAYPFTNNITVTPSTLTLSTTNNSPSYFIDVNTVTLGSTLNTLTPTIDRGTFGQVADDSGTVGTASIRTDVYYLPSNKGTPVYGDFYDTVNDTGT